MSLPVSSVRDMSNERRSRRAKQVRRDERRAKKRNRDSSAEPTLTDILRSALARGHPLHLLSTASLMIHVAKREPRDTSRLHNVLTGLIGVRNRETTALLAVVAELLVDDPAAQRRCRHELAERGEHCRDGSRHYRGSTSTARCAEPMCSAMPTISCSVRDSTVSTS